MEHGYSFVQKCLKYYNSSMKISNHVAHLLLYRPTTFGAITLSAGTLPEIFLFVVLYLLLVLHHLKLV